jgi:hypothetical protein
MKKIIVLILFVCVCFFVGCGDENFPPMNEILQLTFSDTSEMKADGEHKFHILAKIPGNAKENYRTITFTTNSGKFESSGKETVEKQIDSEGKAEVTIVVGTDPGTFSVTASIGGAEPKFSVVERFRLLPLATSDILQVEIAGAANVVADAESIIGVNTTVSNTPVDLVTVTSSKGTFIGSNKETEESKVDQEGKASFQLQVGQTPGKYFITTSITEGIKQTLEVAVNRAYADSLIIEPSALAVGPEEPVQIAVYLRRQSGKVSIGTPVTFSAYQLNGTTKVPVGRFTGTAEGSDANEKITASFHADSGTIDATKMIFIEFSTPQEDSDQTPYTKKIQLTYEQPENGG